MYTSITFLSIYIIPIVSAICKVECGGYCPLTLHWGITGPPLGEVSPRGCTVPGGSGVCLTGVVLRERCGVLRMTWWRKVQRARWKRETGQSVACHAGRRVLVPRSRIRRVRGGVGLVIAGHWCVGCHALQLLHGDYRVVKVN